MSEAKRPGPKRLSPKRPSEKTLSEPSLHDCETSSMIVTFSEAFYDSEVLLLLSFKFDLSLVDWFDLIRGSMMLLIKNFHLEMIF